jgi:myo-inositol-1(or 4)-monophosphatase
MGNDSIVPVISTKDPLRVAVEAAREAGAIVLERLHEPMEIREKGRRADIVTDADRASETAILKRLRAATPDATFVTEESGLHCGTADERWIVDPIDGTTNFAHGYPLFCISIAYERAGELVAGVIYAPAMDECFVAERGAGAQCNGRAIRVSTIENVADALTCTGFHPADFARNEPYFRAVSNRAQAVRRDGSAALDLAYIACGRFDGFWEWDLHAWDVAAGTLVISEAGGRITRVDGTAPDLDARSILATNGLIHAELGAILISASDPAA